MRYVRQSIQRIKTEECIERWETSHVTVPSTPQMLLGLAGMVM
jgi:hypothetical protein